MSLRDDAWERANGCCEYCALPQSCTLLPHEVDHVISQKHNGRTEAGNLCLACYSCNAYKGPNIAGIDPETGEITRLFHPRKDRWSEHFQWNHAELQGLTPIGRTTIDVLRINQAERVRLRLLLQASGLWLPD